MSTPKRERQRQNRLQRVAADEVAAKQYATRRRVKLIGIAAVVVAAALAVLAFLQSRDDPDVVTTDSELPIEDVAVDLSETDPVPDPETAEADGESADGMPRSRRIEPARHRLRRPPAHVHRFRGSLRGGVRHQRGARCASS